MLSPGKYHEGVPRDPALNMRFRRATILRALEDKPFRQGLLEACRLDILFYINTFCWSFNPKKKGLAAARPFITWDFQERALLATPEDSDSPGLLWCYENDKNAVIEKSRDMGATWLLLIMQDWLALFHPYFQSLNISRNEDAVDDKTQDSLFWKLRWMHRHLPDWMTGQIEDTKLYLGYPRTSSAVTGQASTGRAGVSGRAGFIFVDEVAHIREATEIRQRTANVADCRVFVSTHEGAGTEFYRLVNTPEMVQLQMHWTEHPEHKRGLYRSALKNGVPDILDTAYKFPPDYEFVLDGTPTGGPFPGIRSVWYDRKAAEIGDETGVASQLDINPTGSVSQFFSPSLIRELQDAKDCVPPYWEGEVVMDPHTNRVTELVQMKGGPLKLWLIPNYHGLIEPDVFVFGADTATGLGGKGSTNSCLSGIRCRDGEKVLEFASPNIDPGSFAEMTVALCWFFADKNGEGAKLIWEKQGPGDSYGKRVLELNYRNVYKDEDEANPIPGFRRRTEVPGWQPNPKNTRLLMEDYRNGLRTRQMRNRSWIALEECLYWAVTPTGVKHSGQSSKIDPSGAGVNHGDRSVADALAWRLARGLGAKLKREEETRVVVGTLAWRRQLAEAATIEQEW